MARPVQDHRAALHQAARGCVKRVSAVHREAVIPHHEVADAPVVGVDELVAGRGVIHLVEQSQTGTGSIRRCQLWSWVR